MKLSRRYFGVFCPEYFSIFLWRELVALFSSPAVDGILNQLNMLLRTLFSLMQKERFTPFSAFALKFHRCKCSVRIYVDYRASACVSV